MSEFTSVKYLLDKLDTDFDELLYENRTSFEGVVLGGDVIQIPNHKPSNSVYVVRGVYEEMGSVWVVSQNIISHVFVEYTLEQVLRTCVLLERFEPKLGNPT